MAGARPDLSRFGREPLAASVGWLLGKILFDWPHENALSKTGSGVVALAGVLLAYGSNRTGGRLWLHRHFVSGYALRRSETGHGFHRRLHDFRNRSSTRSPQSSGCDRRCAARALALFRLVPRGDRACAYIRDPPGCCLAVACWHALVAGQLAVSFYGVRGIGSVYYLAYAGHHVELVNEQRLWATIAFTICVSTIVHGLTAGLVVERHRRPSGWRGFQ